MQIFRLFYHAKMFLKCSLSRTPIIITSVILTWFLSVSLWGCQVPKRKVIARKKFDLEDNFA